MSQVKLLPGEKATTAPSSPPTEYLWWDSTNHVWKYYNGTAFVLSAAPIVEQVNTVATSGATQTIPDVTAQTMNVITLSANCTFTFPAAVAGKSFTLVLKQDATGSRLATWPGTVKWSGGTAPTLTTAASKSDVFTFLCPDGTNWFGFTAGLNF